MAILLVSVGVVIYACFFIVGCVLIVIDRLFYERLGGKKFPFLRSSHNFIVPVTIFHGYITVYWAFEQSILMQYSVISKFLIVMVFFVGIWFTLMVWTVVRSHFQAVLETIYITVIVLAVGATQSALVIGGFYLFLVILAVLAGFAFMKIRYVYQLPWDFIIFKRLIGLSVRQIWYTRTFPSRDYIIWIVQLTHDDGFQIHESVWDWFSNRSWRLVFAICSLAWESLRLDD